MRDEFVPLYELTIPPASHWPTNIFGQRIAVVITKKTAGTTVAEIPIDLESARGRNDALKLARYLVKHHNLRLGAHRRDQARNRTTRLKLIKEKQHVNAA